VKKLTVLVIGVVLSLSVLFTSAAHAQSPLGVGLLSITAGPEACPSGLGFYSTTHELADHGG
jgi:hypothetical protein